MNELLERLAERLLPSGPFFFGRFDYVLAFIVSNAEIRAMFNEQRYCRIVHGRENGALSLVIAGIRVSTQAKQLLFNVGQKNFMKRRIAVTVTRIHIRASLRKQRPLPRTGCAFI